MNLTTDQKTKIDIHERRIALIYSEHGIVSEQKRIAQKKHDLVERALVKVSGIAHDLVLEDMEMINSRIADYDKMLDNYQEGVRYLTIEIEMIQKGEA